MNVLRSRYILNLKFEQFTQKCCTLWQFSIIILMVLPQYHLVLFENLHMKDFVRLVTLNAAKAAKILVRINREVYKNRITSKLRHIFISKYWNLKERCSGIYFNIGQDKKNNLESCCTFCLNLAHVQSKSYPRFCEKCVHLLKILPRILRFLISGFGKISFSRILEEYNSLIQWNYVSLSAMTFV